MSQCVVSLKKLRNLQERLNGLLEDESKVEEVMQCVTESLKFSQERHAQHMARQVAASKRYQEKMKEDAGVVKTYPETRSRYYAANKEELNRRACERRRLLRDASKKNV
jgi:hypothetical protein